MIRFEPGEVWCCEKCGKRQEPSVWLSAHWDIEVIHTCECGRKIRLECGTQLAVLEEGE